MIMPVRRKGKEAREPGRWWGTAQWIMFVPKAEWAHSSIAMLEAEEYNFDEHM